MSHTKVRTQHDKIILWLKYST